MDTIKLWMVILMAASVSAQVSIGDVQEGIIINPSSTSDISFFDLLEVNETTLTGHGSECVQVNAGETDIIFGNCSNATGGGGAGDITAVIAIGPYILGGGVTGSVDINFSEPELQSEITSFGVDIGFNDTFNATYAIWAYNQTIPAINYFDTTFTASFDSNFSDQTTDDLTQGTTNLYDNQSWSQSLADTLYASIIWAYNQTTAAINYFDTTFTSSFDSNFSDQTTDNLTEGTTNLYDNQSWNESLADTLYAIIGSGGDFFFANFTTSFDNNLSDKTTNDLTQGTTNLYDNQSWNESLANLLYSDIIWGYNQTDLSTLFVLKTGDNMSGTLQMSDSQEIRFRTSDNFIASGAANTLDLSAGLQIMFSIDQTGQFTLNNGVFAPVTNNDVDIGTSILGFKNVYVANDSFIRFRDSGMKISSENSSHLDFDANVSIDFQIDSLEKLFLTTGELSPSEDYELNLGTNNTHYNQIFVNRSQGTPSRSVSVVYQNNDSGSAIIVYGSFECDSDGFAGNAYITAYSDSNNPPTTARLVSGFKAAAGRHTIASFTFYMVVADHDFYRIAKTFQIGNTDCVLEHWNEVEF